MSIWILFFYENFYNYQYLLKIFFTNTVTLMKMNSERILIIRNQIKTSKIDNKK